MDDKENVSEKKEKKKIWKRLLIGMLVLLGIAIIIAALVGGIKNGKIDALFAVDERTKRSFTVIGEINKYRMGHRLLHE